MSGSNETTGGQAWWDDDMLVLERGPEGVRLGNGPYRDERTRNGVPLAYVGYMAVGANMPAQQPFGTESVVV